jgi:hypothetical protein
LCIPGVARREVKSVRWRATEGTISDLMQMDGVTVVSILVEIEGL